ncbi:divergent polysaccharide deacetylase family protein [Pseudidiomarina homiensis]|uniref:Divergent polysaccharide deacetylase family protein n=1 Tax=Pseudidiomarina homiensis TaxID=364198 RepID=A0A432Y6E7_9GAMM|nr:divergent polysaccharide deacetylase family protein [Pseudidiomarina homiensis]RUO56558.1 hypothetical protein CWI70_07410 [Pseudidiomarina homiensis]
MNRCLVILLLLNLSVATAKEATTATPPVDSPQAKPRIAIVIDDLGHHADNHAFVALKYPLTLAIMPFSRKAEELAAAATKAGHEVMIHMPMQPESLPEQTQEVLDIQDTKAQFIATLSAAFSRLPQASGLNNHQGSLMTAEEEQMSWLMHELKQRQMYFLDSRTSVATVAEATARKLGVPSNRRHVFLDNDPSPAAITEQWLQAENIAQKQGYAIVIGHPYPSTLAFLQQLKDQHVDNFELVYFSELLQE